MLGFCLMSWWSLVGAGKVGIIRGGPSVDGRRLWYHTSRVPSTYIMRAEKAKGGSQAEKRMRDESGFAKVCNKTFPYRNDTIQINVKHKGNTDLAPL